VILLSFTLDKDVFGVAVKVEYAEIKYSNFVYLIIMEEI
jgi:hypothetical protein